MDRVIQDTIAIDIGGTKVRIGRINEHGKIAKFVDFATPASEAQMLDVTSKTVQSLSLPHGPAAIGIAGPAFIDREKGTIGPCTHIPTWKKLPIVEILHKEFDCPVAIENDATMGGVCEALVGNGRPYRYILYVTVSTGIGSTLILDGMPLPGPYNPQGGQMILVDHAKKPLYGSYEYLASGKAILREYGKIAADIRSAKAWHVIARPLAQGLYNLIVATNPQVVILGGGVSKHYKKFIKPLKLHLKDFSYPPKFPIPPIIQAKHVETAPLIGAGLMAHGLHSR
jgi:glucokinase